MNIYKITVRETVHVKYEIEADSEDEARDLLAMGDQRVVDIASVDWDIIEIKEYI